MQHLKKTNTKLYVPVVTLSTENNNKLLKQIKSGFKTTIKWNICRSEMSNQTKNNNSNCLFDPTYTKVNRFFVLSFENERGKLHEKKNFRLMKICEKDQKIIFSLVLHVSVLGKCHIFWFSQMIM